MQFKWLAGEALLTRGQHRDVGTVCGVVLFQLRYAHAIQGQHHRQHADPVGTLDVEPGMRPTSSIFWKSKSA